MNFVKTSTYRKNHGNSADRFKKTLGFLIILTLVLNFFYLVNNFSLANDEFKVLDSEDEFVAPKSADIGYLFQDPFKQNFKDMWQFFKSRYLSGLELQLDTYYREGSSSGIILDDKVYSLDNMLLYKSLLKDETNATETFDYYLKLRNSIFWYAGNVNQYKYGFVRSVDNSTKEVYDDDRYLIDNLMPIFLLIENVGEDINSNIGGQYPKNNINEMFYLINSSEFWDETNEGFYDHNSTTDKYTESNLYAILANLEIHKIYKEIGINPTIQKRAYDLANMTMRRLLSEEKGVWDYANGGFDYYALSDWSTGSDYKYLNVNALGIIALIEFWKETGMTNDTYLQFAKSIYDKLGNKMWDSGFNAYEYSRDGVWDISGAIRTIELESNSLMLTACLKLFETTGNITYYNRAWQLYQTFENDFYENSGAIHAYRQSIDSPLNNNKNFYTNLKLCEAYIYAAEIYNSTKLITSLNASANTPNFIFNQDTMKIKSTYAFEKNIEFFNISTKTYKFFKSQYNISSADITYLFKFPNGTVLEKRNKQIVDEFIILLYHINDTIPIGDDYYLYIYANTSIFATAATLKRYNVVSGIKNEKILGLPSTLYQGPTLNITLQMNNTRNEAITLNVSMQGDDIYSKYQIAYLPVLVLTNLSFDLTAKLGANLGYQNITFQFKKDGILYLEIIRTIYIGYSFDYSNFIYEDRVINGGNIDVSLTIKNFLPNSSQYINISFTGEHLNQDTVFELVLAKSEIRTLYYTLSFKDDIISNTTAILMEIKKGDTLYYNKSFTIQIVPKFEILSVNFPQVVSQGEYAHFILVIQNNNDSSEGFSLYANGVKLTTNINGLGPGVNYIMAEVLPTINPYDFESKSYTFVLKDGSNNPIVQFYFEVKIELSPFNLIVFYLLPILIPVAIVLFYKNKEIKHKLLRR